MDRPVVTLPPAENRHLAPFASLPFGGVDWTKLLTSWGPWPGVAIQQAIEYGLDAWQRSVLFLDIMRQRGDNYFAQRAEKVPHVLHFDFEVVMGGWELERPVNYALVRIIPPAGTATDPKKRPFIVFDPRAGHGPGIGGMKHDSEIGVALGAGHPCYFVGFMPDPVPGQTIEDVCRAEALFVKKVAQLHPDADGKPCLIGNCQAGWQIAMMSAIWPDLAGPLMLAGTPLSYWAGVHGKNPMRYLGGILGGTWLTSLAGDFGHGLFDGAYLIGNFEALNPANTYWEKGYNVYSKVDTEGPRFLEFETWWGSPVLLNANEMQFIADELFVGNKLSSGDIYTSGGVRIDLRNIKSPIIVFCSFGDNITPPQQALGWILDLYDTDHEIVANGQTIIYALHQTIGHLGIFVSAKVATKEHQEFTEAMDLIDVLPPGLYEAVITEKGKDTRGAEFVTGNYVIRFEGRSLAHIRALGGNDAADDLRFATVARLSEINQGIYRMFVSPFVQTLVGEHVAEWLRSIHPYRMRYAAFSDKNLFLRPVTAIADMVRENRQPVESGNPFRELEREVSRQLGDALNAYRDIRDGFIESWFMNVYGSPVLQTMVGLRADAATARRRVGRDVSRQEAFKKAKAELEDQVERGGLREAMVRALLYVGLGHERPGVDERSFAALSQIRERAPETARMNLAQFKELVREQYLLLRLDEARSVAAIAGLLPPDPAERSLGLDIVRHVVSALGEPSGEVKARLERVESLFDAHGGAEPATGLALEAGR